MAIPLSPIFLKLQQFQTNAGAPAASYKIFTYLAGTTTPTTLFTESDGSVAAANPYTLSATGRTADTLYLPNSTGVKLIYTNASGPASPTPIPVAGVTISTDDNIENPGAVAFATLGQILATGSKAVASGYTTGPDDNLVTVSTTGVTPGNAQVTIDELASERGFPLIIMNAGTVDLDVNFDGGETINGAATPFVIPASVAPNFNAAIFLPLSPSAWYALAAPGFV